MIHLDGMPDREQQPSADPGLPLDELFEHCPDGLVVTDLAGGIRRANRRALELVGDQRVIGERLWTLFDARDRDAVERGLRTLAMRPDVVCELAVELAGAGRLVSVRGARAGEGADSVATWALRVERDDAAQHRLARASALKDAYLLALSHDLRSPIATLSGVVEVLSGPLAGRERGTELVQLMGQAVETIQGVIANLLDLQRLQHRGVEVQRQPTSLGPFVDLCVRRAALTRPVHVEVPDADVPLDPGLVERILANLLGNADRHSPPGGELRIRALLGEGEITFVVEDEGPGIPDDQKDVAFELFRQLGEDGGDGVGVGLFLVREFAVAHGGWAWFADRPGGGTAAHVRLAT